MSTELQSWLSKIGLEQYTEVLLSNDVDLDILASLSESDLRELGFSLGHRKRLLKALLETKSPAPPQPQEVERRQLTVMFCDLVGSTALSSDLDPEDYRELMTSYQRAASDAVRRYGGHVAKYLGDGLLAYFGYPDAHEDDAERAARAGLACIQAVARLRDAAGDPLKARVGIATGLVIIGDVSEASVREEAAVSGETPNLAARLESAAKPGQVLIDESTYRLIKDAFLCDDLGPKKLKGIGDNVPTYRVTAPRATLSRFDARQAEGGSSFVGRKQEVARIMACWERAAAGEGQVVLICGEAGLGKSRLTERLHELVSEHEPRRLVHQCSAYHGGTALYPVITHLQHLSGIATTDTAAERQEKLETFLSPFEEKDTFIPLIASLLSVDLDASYPKLKMEAEEQRERTFDALIHYLTYQHRQETVLLVFEDLHWIDPTTQELLARLTRKLHGKQALLAATARPEYTLAWPQQENMTSIHLRPLAPERCAELVRSIAPDKDIEELVAQVVAKADGIPLFVEELFKSVLEAGPSTEIPSSLQASLLSRLDRLGPAKRLMQIGAAIGRQFDKPLLAELADMDDQALDEQLEQLLDSGLLSAAQSNDASWSYTFKHALIQDTAYSSQTKRARKELHTRIAKTLAKRYPETAQASPELLAQHYAKAGMSHRAITLFNQAASGLLSRSALLEAIGHLSYAMTLLEDLAAGQERDELELTIQVYLADAYTGAHGWMAEKTGATFSRAIELARNGGRDDLVIKLLPGLCAHHLERGELTASRADSDELLALATRSNDNRAQLLAQARGIHLQYWLGELDELRLQIPTFLELYQTQMQSGSQESFDRDPLALVLADEAIALSILGFPDQAECKRRQAITHARKNDRALAQGFCCFFASVSAVFRRDTAACLEAAETVFALEKEFKIPSLGPYGWMIKGMGLAEGDDPKAAAPVLEEALALWKASGAQLFMPHLLVSMGNLCLRLGKHTKGLEAISTAEELVQRTGELVMEPEILRLKGELTFSIESGRQAEALLRGAHDLAQARGHRTWQLRSALSLARYLAAHGKSDEAKCILQAIYNTFTEGLQTQDLLDARALLDTL